MKNILALHADLKNKTYRHSAYRHFRINDPKQRDIHKASVRDRLLHHAIYRVLYSFFSRSFASDSHSCQNGKGTHRALKRFEKFSRTVSKNNTKQCFILKCDIRKFFATIDHSTLLYIIVKYVEDRNVVWLLEKIISSFETTAGKGLPLGNLTSQLLVNIYMNEFDQFVKHKLKAKYYIRYADDFVILHTNKDYLTNMRHGVYVALAEKLKLELHPDKVFIKTLASGVDFLGWVHFPNHRILRTTTKRRMLKKLSLSCPTAKEVKASYLGMLRWGNAYKLKLKL